MTTNTDPTSDNITVHLNQNETSTFRHSKEDIIKDTVLRDDAILEITFSRPVSIRNVILLKIYNAYSKRVISFLDESQLHAKYVFKHNIPLNVYQMLYKTQLKHTDKNSTLLIEFIIRPADVAAIGSLSDYRKMSTVDKLNFLYNETATKQIQIDLAKCDLKTRANYGLSIECYDFELQLQYIADIKQFIICHSDTPAPSDYVLQKYLDTSVSSMTRSDYTTSTCDIDSMTEIPTEESTQLQTEPDTLSITESIKETKETVSPRKEFVIQIADINEEHKANEKEAGLIEQDVGSNEVPEPPSVKTKEPVEPKKTEASVKTEETKEPEMTEEIKIPVELSETIYEAPNKPSEKIKEAPVELVDPSTAPTKNIEIPAVPATPKPSARITLVKKQVTTTQRTLYKINERRTFTPIRKQTKPHEESSDGCPALKPGRPLVRKRDLRTGKISTSNYLTWKSQHSHFGFRNIKKKLAEILTIAYWIFFLSLMLVPSIKRKAVDALEVAVVKSVHLYRNFMQQEKQGISTNRNDHVKPETWESPESTRDDFNANITQNESSEVTRDIPSSSVEFKDESTSINKHKPVNDSTAKNMLMEKPLVESETLKMSPPVEKNPGQNEPEVTTKRAEPAQQEIKAKEDELCTGELIFFTAIICGIIIPTMAYNMHRDIKRIKKREEMGWYDIKYE